MSEKLNKLNLNKAEKFFKSEKYKEAFPLYEELAYKGVSQAQYRLGCIYDEGHLDGGVANFELAVYWFRKAAEQDDIDSQFNLAGYYCTGEGVEISYADAYYWFRRASRLGDAGAQEKIISLKNTISSDNFNTLRYVIRGYDYSNVVDSVSALIEEWNSERKRDLFIYLNKIWDPTKEDISYKRSKLAFKDLMKIIEIVSHENCYEILADILDFEFFETECTKKIYRLTELFTLKSIRSEEKSSPVFGKNISIFKELKIAFDGFSENNEEDIHNSMSYVTYINKDAFYSGFVFEDHEITPVGVMLRPGSEVHIFSWFNKKENSLEVINVEDQLNNDEMSPVNIFNILFNLVIKYNLVKDCDQLVDSADQIRGAVIKGLLGGSFNLKDDEFEEYRNDREAVLAAVKTSGYALEYADDSLKGDREIVLAAVGDIGSALEYASAGLRADREIVALAVNNNHHNFRYAHESILGDLEFIQSLIAKFDDPNLLYYFSDKLKANKKFVINLLKINPFNINHVSNALWNDKEILAAVFGDFKSESLDDEEGLEQLLDLLRNNYEIQYMNAGETKREVGKGMVNICCLSSILTNEPDTEIMFFVIKFQVQSILLKTERVKNDGYLPYLQKHYFKDEDRSAEISNNTYFNEFLNDLELIDFNDEG